MATGNQVLRAYGRAVKAFDKAGPGLVAHEASAGFIIPPGQKRGHREGYQVFVKVCRYSDDLLRSNRESGGLLCNA